MSDERVVDEFAVQIGARIRAFREEHGMTQTDLAERTGIPRQQFGRYEMGVDLPLLRTAIVLARFMGILVDELLFGKQEDDIRVADPVLRERFLIIDRMSSDRRNAAADLMDMFITRELQHAKKSEK